MASVTVRVRDETRRKLAEMAKREGRSIPEVIAALVERAEADAMIAEHLAAMERLRADPEQWKDYQRELEEWDATLMDGLEDDPWPVDERGEPQR
jgi:predicted CopG family antitoxin